MATLFEKIIAREIPADIIYEDKQVIAIKDINPKNPGHFLVIPKNVSTNLMDISDSDYKYLLLKAKELANKTIKDMKVSGYQLIINNGANAGQEVFHTHVHIIPSRK